MTHGVALTVMDLCFDYQPLHFAFDLFEFPIRHPPVGVERPLFRFFGGFLPVNVLSSGTGLHARTFRTELMNYISEIVDYGGKYLLVIHGQI